MSRILLKLSGEQLAGEARRGFSVERAEWIAEQVKRAKAAAPEMELVVVVGGGNFVRGEYFKDTKISRITADQMGMFSIMMNALALSDIFNACGLETVALTNVFVDQLIEPFSYRKAVAALRDGKVVIVAGGRPYCTSDSIAATAAVELECDKIAKATKVNGVYDSDPEQNPEAQRIEEMTFKEAITNEKVRVMDKTALATAADRGLEIIVFELLGDGNIEKIARGERVGSLIRV